MKKQLIFICVILLSLLAVTGCSSSSGPDKNSLAPLETAPNTSYDTTREYERGESIVIYQENLSDGVNFQLYEDGKLVLSGADITISMGDAKAFQDYRQRRTLQL